MALELVPASDQYVGAATARHHQIVGDEAMSALDQIQDALRFPDAAPSDHQ